ncbi:CHASE2 domain-containing protein [Synechococcales cyanobacterium C]|uniref:CHASE2 domain-containing protein n=1 Tax=Petrachloros mirabilis ULC683 TaxID=2781853 RepID=A0A8K2A8K7_9CYAN|nr:adenylate/guanylate cyclase domain-containing protein [Petrachloros mirabilis]NCJ08149.1 CHASE2 domain-containing protein [Petrachloros mirabilis ULC683]
MLRSKILPQLQRQWLEWSAVVVASLVIPLLVVGVRQMGWMQLLQLIAFDRLTQLRPDLAPDPRLLVVGITEEDIQAQGRWPISDQTFAQMLGNLQRLEPRAVGLDVYRDLPVEPGHSQFLAQFQASDRLFVVTKLSSEFEPAIAPPPDVPDAQVGFNDVAVDPGGVIRRNLLIQDGRFSFSLQLARRYLQDDGIEAQASDINPDYMQLGAATFVPLTPHAGDYIDVDASGYQILLNYRNRFRAAQVVSLSQVLDGTVPPEWVRDRIVLVGTVAESGKDFFYTPYSSGLRDQQRMAGVMIHAQMVSQFLDAALGERSQLRWWSQSWEILWILGWGILGGGLAWGIRHPLGLALAGSAALSVLWMSCAALFFNAALWVPLVAPTIAFLATGGSTVTYSAQQAQRQQKMVMRLLGQNTSPAIAETLWQRRDELLEDGKLLGQKVTATLLFTDLQGFTTLSESMPPEMLLTWLNEYLEAMSQVVQDHHGVINKFMGDGIMALFGVPIPDKGEAAIALNAQRAVACSLDMGKRLEQLNHQWQSRNLPTVSMRAGLFTGSVVVGSMGGKTRLEYGVLGDSVNIASRLENLEKHRQAPPCRILIAQETLTYLQDQFQVESWGAITLKGKAKPVHVYRVLGAAQSEATPPSLQPSEPSGV